MAGTIITIAQQKGGSGKTTLATHLSVAWTQQPGSTVALLDVDPQGSLGEWFERREDRLGEGETGLQFRTASGWGARREAHALARDYDMVVLDTPPRADLEARTAIEAADLVVVPVQPTPADLWGTRDTLVQANKEGKGTALVLSRVPPRARLTDHLVAALRELDVDLMAAQLGNRIAFAESIGLGSTALEWEPKGKAADETRSLAAELLRKVRA